MTIEWTTKLPLALRAGGFVPLLFFVVEVCFVLYNFSRSLLQRGSGALSDDPSPTNSFLFKNFP